MMATTAAAAAAANQQPFLLPLIHGRDKLIRRYLIQRYFQSIYPVGEIEHLQFERLSTEANLFRQSRSSRNYR